MSEADDDRDLDAFLARRSPVTDAWRNAARETRAPDALDAGILRASTEAPMPAVLPPARRSRGRRWRLPIGLAASLLVGIGVLREVERDPASRGGALAERAIAAAAPAAAVESAVGQGEPASATPSAPALPSPDAAEQRSFERERHAAMAKRAAAARQKQVAPPPRIVAASPPPPPAESDPAPAPRVMADASAPLPPESLAQRAERAVAEPQRPASAAQAAAPAFADVFDPAAMLAIGRTTPDEVRARFGEPDGAIEGAADGGLLLRYARTLDPRGTLRLRFDPATQRLVETRLRVDPPLSLVRVRRDERLDEPVHIACEHAEDGPIEDLAARTLHWPSRGLRLSLDGAGHVIEIERRAACR